MEGLFLAWVWKNEYLIVAFQNQQKDRVTWHYNLMVVRSNTILLKLLKQGLGLQKRMNTQHNWVSFLVTLNLQQFVTFTFLYQMQKVGHFQNNSETENDNNLNFSLWILKTDL